MNKITYTILLYLTYIGFILDDIKTIGVPIESQSRFYVIGIPSRDIALFIMLGIFYLHRKMILSTINRNVLYLFILLFCIFTLQGIIINGLSSTVEIRADIRALLWFLGGISFAFILVKTGNVKLNLQVIVGLTTFLLIAATVYSDSYKTVIIFGMSEFSRIAEGGMFRFSSLLFVPLILLFNLEGKKIKHQIVPLFCIGSLLYCNVYLSNTRSMGITMAMILILYFISLRLRNILINRVNVFISIGIAVILISLIAYLLIQLSYIEPRLERLFNISATAVSNDPRYFEGIQFIEQSLEKNYIIFGQGLGGKINSALNPNAATGTLHIGILNFWMKMGIIPFILVSVFMFLRVPYLYIKSLISKRIFSIKKRTASLIILPSIFPWIIALAVSGGYVESSFLSAGIAYLMYVEVCKNGMKRIIG